MISNLDSSKKTQKCSVFACFRISRKQKARVFTCFHVFSQLEASKSTCFWVFLKQFEAIWSSTQQKARLFACFWSQEKQKARVFAYFWSHLFEVFLNDFVFSHVFLHIFGFFWKKAQKSPGPEKIIQSPRNRPSPCSDERKFRDRYIYIFNFISTYCVDRK